MAKKERNLQIEKGLYTGGWILLLTAGALAAVEKFGNVSLSLFPCMVHKWTGYYCPGCGGTRAVRALLQGDFLQSFVYHPVVVYGAVLYVWFMVSHTIEYLTIGRWRIGMQYTDKYLYEAVGIILAQWVVKNAVKAIWGVGI